MSLKGSLAAVATMALFWYTAWLGGYNFDTRNFLVAYWFIMSVLFSFFAYHIVKIYE